MFDFLMNTQPEEHLHNPGEKTLYERLGGIFAITAVIDNFSDNIINNPIAGRESKNEALRDLHRNHLGRLPGLKFMRSLWVAAVSGGPYTFVPTVPESCPFNLKNAHSKFNITSDEFDAVAGELIKSLDFFKVPAQEKKEVLAVFSMHKRDVVDHSGEC